MFSELLTRSAIIALALLLSGCLMTAKGVNPAQPLPDPNTPIAPPLTPDTATGRWVDEREHVRGICFEAGWDAAGQIFILRDAADHVRFYDLADNSNLCRRPVGRVPRDFSAGYTIIGLWSAGRGSTAAHDVNRVQRDADRQTLVIEVTFSTVGDCPYDLLRPWWIGVEGVADYEITLIVNEGQTLNP